MINFFERYSNKDTGDQQCIENYNRFEQINEEIILSIKQQKYNDLIETFCKNMNQKIEINDEIGYEKFIDYLKVFDFYLRNIEIFGKVNSYLNIR